MLWREAAKIVTELEPLYGLLQVLSLKALLLHQVHIVTTALVRAASALLD